MSDHSNRIRVMRIIARLNIGGPAIHVSLLTQRLDREQYDTRLVVGSISEDEGDMTYYAESLGVQPDVVPNLQRQVNIVQDIRVLMAIYRLMREYEPHVVHTHTAKAGFIGRLAAKMAGVPVIVHTFHGHVFKGYFGPVKTQVFLWLERLAARFSDTIITLTDSLRRELAEEYRITRKSRMTVLPLGLDLQAFAKVERKTGAFLNAWDIPTDVPVVGIVARMAPVKNHALFVEAAALVHEQRPNVRFVIVGDGETREDVIAQIKKLGLDDVFTLTGWLQGTPEVYADLDLKVITSHNEGTPVTLIEALTAGCPVVSTDMGGVGELLDGGTFGALVSAGDAQAVASAIITTLDNPPDPETARRAMIHRYGIDRLVRDIQSLYLGLLMRKGLDPRQKSNKPKEPART
jgi:glycosyltransferase involved in cell wall biosynthesis